MHTDSPSSSHIVFKTTLIAQALWIVLILSIAMSLSLIMLDNLWLN